MWKGYVLYEQQIPRPFTIEGFIMILYHNSCKNKSKKYKCKKFIYIYIYIYVYIYIYIYQFRYVTYNSSYMVSLLIIRVHFVRRGYVIYEQQIPRSRYTFKGGN